MSEERSTQREIAQEKMNSDIMYALGEIKGTMKGMEQSFSQLAPIVADHEKRIEASEKSLYNVKVKIGLLGAFIGAFVSISANWIWSKLTGH